jgi:maleylpyruvate isomerase
MITLHDFYRSSASFRVRIALNLKGLAYQSMVRDLDTGAQSSPGYRSINPQGLLPALEIDGHVLTQSAAILEFLDAKFPEPPLLPKTELERARVRALFQFVVSDTHPITTMRVGRYLKQSLDCEDAAIARWKQHWITECLSVLETALASDRATGRFSHGNQVSLADVALVPQVVSARGLGLSIERFPTVSRIYEACMQVTAFENAHPDKYPTTPTLNKD